MAARLAALVEELARDNRFRLAAVQGDAALARLPSRLGRRRHAALGSVPAPAPGQRRADPQLRPLPERVRPAAARAARLPARAPAAPRRWCGCAPRNPRCWRWPRRSGSRWPAGPSSWSEGSRPRIGFSGDWIRTPSSRSALDTAAAPAPARAGTQLVGSLAIPVLRCAQADSAADSARLVVTRTSGTLAALQRGLNTWFLVSLAVTALLAVALAAWLSRLISRPLTELAGKTAAIDLDRLDRTSPPSGEDEIGALSPAARRDDRATPHRCGPASRRRAPGRDGRPGAPGESRHQERPGAHPERASPPGRGRPGPARDAARGVRGAAGDAGVERGLPRHPGPQLRQALARRRARGMRRERDGVRGGPGHSARPAPCAPGSPAGCRRPPPTGSCSGGCWRTWWATRPTASRPAAGGEVVVTTESVDPRRRSAARPDHRRRQRARA